MNRNEYGWAGNILWIDLDKNTIAKESIPVDWRKKFLGGRGINVKILFDHLKAGTDPFSPENVLILGTGPLVGTILGSRIQATGLSPLTGFLGDSNAGGHWGNELKYAGYDHIVFEGKSDKPVYIWIDDDTVEIRDAEGLWGKNVWEVTQMIRERENDPSIQVLAIGQAGENLVRYACIINTFSRACGRTGMGAIMGTKGVKCVAVRGTKGIKIAKPKEFKETIEEIYSYSVNHPMYEWYPRYGTSMLTEHKARLGILPIKNFSTSMIEGLDDVTGETFVAKYARKSRACYGCFFHCDHFFESGEITGPGLEYESINNFGPRVGNTDFPTILLAHNLANQYGLDVVSAGTSIALAMDLYERGILTKKDTDSLELKWGNREAIIKCVHKIATREGFGDLLAEGPYIMAQKIGGKAPSLVMHFKKMCPTSNEVRPMKGLALGYATSTVGATHLRGVNRAEGGAATREQVMELFGTEDMMNPTLYDTVGKPKGVQYYQRLAAICDCLEICKFNTFWTSYPTYIKQLARLFNLVTGVESNENQFEEIADRVYLLEKAFNTREGYTWKDDLPCERMQNEPISDGKHKGEVLNRESFIEMLKAYYKITGCDIETGIPTYQTLSKLGLSEVADQLVALGKIENNQ